ncbi:MAG: gliding motility lipoprotein GldD [Crocinitomicaceae bacterium]
MSKSKWMFLIAVVFITLSCGGDEVDYYPKPMGFLRLDFPERNYVNYASECNYGFEIPSYFSVIDKPGTCNKDILIERFNASLFLTYIPVDTNLNMNIEYSRKLVYDHSIKADDIQEAVVKNEELNSYGVKYNIVGNAASPYQFYMTDSTDHFLRGALYFNVAPNYDSLKPSLDYIITDIDHLIESVNWNEYQAPDSLEAL